MISPTPGRPGVTGSIHQLSRWWIIPIMIVAHIPFWCLDGVVEAKPKETPA